MWNSTMSTGGYVFWAAIFGAAAIVIYLVFVAPFFLRGTKDPDERMKALYVPIAAIVVVMALLVALWSGGNH